MPVDHTTVTMFERGVEDIANLTTAGRMGTSLFRKLRENSSAAHLRRGLHSLYETVNILDRDQDVLPKTDRDILCRQHDKLQTEGEELETLLQQPFKIKNMLTGKALRVNWRAGGFEEQAVKLNDKTKRTSARCRSKSIQNKPSNQANVDDNNAAAAEATAVNPDAQDIEEDRELVSSGARDDHSWPSDHVNPLSGGENIPLPCDSSTLSVAKDFNAETRSDDETIPSPKHIYPPDAYKSL